MLCHIESIKYHYFVIRWFTGFSQLHSSLLTIHYSLLTDKSHWRVFPDRETQPSLIQLPDPAPYYSTSSLLPTIAPAPAPYYSSSSLLQFQLPATAPAPQYSSSSLLQLQLPNTAPAPYYSSSSLLQLQLPTTAPCSSLQLQLLAPPIPADKTPGQGGKTWAGCCPDCAGLANRLTGYLGSINQGGGLQL